MQILLVDDDVSLCQLLQEYLTAHGFQLTMAHDGEAGLNLALTHQFDLILLDVMLPVFDGFEVLKRLRTQSVTPILMLTAKGDEFDKVLGLELGADDYLAKPFNHRELLARVKALTRRATTFNPALAPLKEQSNTLCAHGVELHLSGRKVLANQHELTLTGTEFEVLALMMKNMGDIVSKDSISENVLQRRLAPFDRAIDMHVSNIRRKIAEYIQKDIIKTVRGAGYVFITEAS